MKLNANPPRPVPHRRSTQKCAKSFLHNLGRLPPVSQDSRMAAFDFSAAQAVTSMAEGQQASVSIQSLLMQIYADAVCLVRTPF